ncbi:hypothetical protein ISCGN_030170 [Ixodes scapularis]
MALRSTLPPGRWPWQRQQQRNRCHRTVQRSPTADVRDRQLRVFCGKRNVRSVRPNLTSKVLVLSEEDTLALLRCEMVRELQQVESLVVPSIPKGGEREKEKRKAKTGVYEQKAYLMGPQRGDLSLVTKVDSAVNAMCGLGLQAGAMSCFITSF